jgi:hypothetical protein
MTVNCKAEGPVKLCVLTKLNDCLNCHLMYKILTAVGNFSTLVWLINFEDLIAFAFKECVRIMPYLFFRQGDKWRQHFL